MEVETGPVSLNLAWKLSVRIPLTAIKSSRGTIESVPKGVDVLMG